MKMYLVLLSLVTIYHIVESSPGESAIITLVFPYGARACGMGESGTALADDESALFIRNRNRDF
ncbi:MAG: hypothetical protein GX640_03860 [Fibrobacter sp.]|nr:hypothetical protein [Fibrobacter sp.]